MSGAKSLKGIFVQMILATAVVAVLSGNLFADSANVWNFTENSSSQATVDFRLQGTSYPFTVLGGDNWVTGALPFTLPCSPFSYPSGIYCGVSYGYVVWIEPDNPLRYNVLLITPNGNLGETAFGAASDLTATDVANIPSGCSTVSGRIPCPILRDGQSFDVPLSHYNPNTLVQFGTMTMTFHDRGDIPGTTPEPQGLLLLPTGLAAFGAIWRRRSAAGLKNHA